MTSISKSCKSNFQTHSRTHIYNQTFDTAIIPSELKVAVVTLISKSNDKKSYSNYRPISVLPCFLKILEKLMYKRVIKFLDKHNMRVLMGLTDRRKTAKNVVDSRKN